MSEMSEMSSSESEIQEKNFMKEAAVRFMRRNVKLAHNGLIREREQSLVVKGARQLFGFSLEQGMKWLGSEDPTFFSAIQTFSKGAIEKSLTDFSSTQTAKLLGNIISIKEWKLNLLIIRCVCVSSLS